MKHSSLLIAPSSSIKLPRCVRRILSAHPSQSDCRPRLRSACESPRWFPLTANSSLGTSFMLLRDLGFPDAFDFHGCTFLTQRTWYRRPSTKVQGPSPTVLHVGQGSLRYSGPCLMHNGHCA